MDAHSFRILSSAFIPLLYSARIDKIYGPLPDLTVLVKSANSLWLSKPKGNSPDISSKALPCQTPKVRLLL